jgi:hypothetical protein
LIVARGQQLHRGPLIGCLLRRYATFTCSDCPASHRRSPRWIRLVPHLVRRAASFVPRIRHLDEVANEQLSRLGSNAEVSPSLWK